MSDKDFNTLRLIVLWICFIVTNIGLNSEFNKTNELIKEVKIDCNKRR